MHARQWSLGCCWSLLEARSRVSSASGRLLAERQVTAIISTKIKIMHGIYGARRRPIVRPAIFLATFLSGQKDYRERFGAKPPAPPVSWPLVALIYTLKLARIKDNAHTLSQRYEAQLILQGINVIGPDELSPLLRDVFRTKFVDNIEICIIKIMHSASPYKGLN